MSYSRINTVVASAGAGKTTRIVGTIAEEVTKRAPEEIVATTFTIKAADELIERSRAHLFKNGKAEMAARLLGARFGTVNSICGQIVSEQAIDLGRSPRSDVIPEDGVSHVFAVAADTAIERYAPTLNLISDTFGDSEPKRPQDGDRRDWRTTVRRIIDLGRSNGLDEAGLLKSAELSKSTFLSLLPPAAADDAATLDEALSRAVSAAVAAVPAVVSATAAGHVTLLRRIKAAFYYKEPISWPDWARLTKVKCAQKDGPNFEAALAAVIRAAVRHPEHPRLREHCEAFIENIFACAAEALGAYQRYKAQRGLLDFVDQEALSLAVLNDPTMAEKLGERIGRVFVDEFQDSSPLQIAIFTAMAELVDQSTWVGDPKQAIYGFRNADSALTQAAFDGVAALSLEPQDVLRTSYRSRSGIVELVNTAFEPAFTAMGLPATAHSFEGTARTEVGFTHSPFAVWWLDGNVDKQFSALAAGIRDALEQGSEWKVDDRSGGVRPLAAGDTAVLCRSKADITKIATALSALGVKVAVERDGLLRTPHAGLVLASLRWVADPSDRLALAELARYLNDDPFSDSWLQAAGAEDPNALKAAVSISNALEALREKVFALTPAELLDAIIQVPEVTRRIEQWGNPDTRLEDFEALRGFAKEFEAGCRSSGVPATPSGLILALQSEDPQRPKSLQHDAVKVMTYHGAKGLEWPLVVLTGLNREPKARLFEPVAEVDGELDWQNPLANRWVRFWPWPYGALSKDVALDDAALNSSIGQLASKRAKEEETRLLYVGLTRARDYLAFAPAVKSSPHWFSVLDTNQTGHVKLPSGAENLIVAGTRTFPARVSPLAIDDTNSPAQIRPTQVRVARPVVDRPALHRRPSTELAQRSFTVVNSIALGPRLPVTGTPDMRLMGEAVHAIYAADDPEESDDWRIERATGILKRWNVTQIQAAEVIQSCNRLKSYLASSMPGLKLYREAPIFAKIEDQLVSGRIDLLGEYNDSYLIFDHKSFPGSRDTWEAKALEYAGQLAVYGQAVTVATGRNCDRLFVHMPIVGVLLELGT